MSPLTLGIVAGAEWPADPALCLAITAEIAAKSAELQALTMALNVYRDALHAAEMQLVAAQSRHPASSVKYVSINPANDASATLALFGSIGRGGSGRIVAAWGFRPR